MDRLQRPFMSKKDKIGTKPCRRGQSCYYLRKGQCWFYHPQEHKQKLKHEKKKSVYYYRSQENDQHQKSNYKSNFSQNLNNPEQKEDYHDRNQYLRGESQLKRRVSNFDEAQHLVRIKREEAPLRKPEKGVQYQKKLLDEEATLKRHKQLQLKRQRQFERSMQIWRQRQNEIILKRQNQMRIQRQKQKEERWIKEQIYQLKIFEENQQRQRQHQRNLKQKVDCPVQCILQTRNKWFFQRNRHIPIVKELAAQFQDCSICCLDYLKKDDKKQDLGIRKSILGFFRSLFTSQDPPKIQYVTELYCKHHFHTECIQQWLYKNNENPTCPMCRKDFTKYDQYSKWDQNHKAR